MEQVISVVKVTEITASSSKSKVDEFRVNLMAAFVADSKSKLPGDKKKVTKKKTAQGEKQLIFGLAKDLTTENRQLPLKNQIKGSAD